MKEYIVPQEVYDRITELIDSERTELMQLDKDLTEAREFGDLAENATYDGLKSRKDSIKKLYESNQDEQALLTVGTTEEIQSLGNNLYSTITYELTNVSNETLLEKNKVILVPPFDLHIVDSLYDNSILGKQLLKAEKGEIVFTQNNVAIAIKVKKIEPYSPERLRFKNGTANINSVVSAPSA